MAEDRIELERISNFRKILPLCLVIVLIFSTTAGCIDEGVADSLIDIVDGNNGSGYVWDTLLAQNGSFTLEPNDDTEIDAVRIATKVAENITSLDPAHAIENMKIIMNEENLSMKKYSYPFFVPRSTRILNIELIGTFVTSIGIGTQSAGYMELTIHDPDGRTQTYQITQLREEQMFIYSQEPLKGEWELELQGVGLQSPGNLLYSGMWDLSVRAEMQKDS
jgi:hypothetical protein